MHPKIHDLKVRAITIPTDLPESDGTYRWKSTTLILVQVFCEGFEGIGYSYCHDAAAHLIEDKLREQVIGETPFDSQRIYLRLWSSVRNIGRPGIASSAISAVDTAVWDLKAKLLGISMLDLLGAYQDKVDLYGSGGFTSYTERELKKQLSSWVEAGFGAVKMKVGRNPDEDLKRVQWARRAIGENVELFVDANGAYDSKQALRLSEAFWDRFRVSWFEEPVSSDDFQGLKLIRERAPSGMEIAAGEYGYDVFYFERMLSAGAVDVVQLDITRCGGVSGFLQAADVAFARHIPVSAHTAPSLHAHVCCALPGVRHVEYFHDHVRIEERIFEGVLQPVGGCLKPDRSRPGWGIRIKESELGRLAA